MSHYTVMIIGEDPEEQLAPFNEQPEKDSPYLEFEDRTEDYKKEYETLGNDDGLFKDQYKTFEEFVEDYHGDEPNDDGRYGYNCNPNAKWDWYSLGGRWTGFLKLKADAKGAYVGTPGLMTSMAKPGYADAAPKKCIDFEAMREDKAKKAAEDYDYAMKIIQHLPECRSWSSIGEELNYSDEARAIYGAQPRVAAWNYARSKPNFPFGYMSSPSDFSMPREQYIETERNSAGVTFALLKDGVWYEKGQMGWFAMVADEKEQNNWNAEFAKMLDAIEPDTLISVYDCHI